MSYPVGNNTKQRAIQKAFSELTAKEGVAISVHESPFFSLWFPEFLLELTGWTTEQKLPEVTLRFFEKDKNKTKLKADKNACMLRPLKILYLSPKLDLYLTSAFSKDDVETRKQSQIQI